MSRRRLDLELVRRGLVASPGEARAVVLEGRVTVAGRNVRTPGSLVAAADALDVAGPPRRFVSRGGEKLEAALDRFGIDVRGRDALDAGASSGGFTDCLLQRGAARVAAVDVGYGQLAWSIRTDPRVVVLERTNVRELPAADLPFEPAIVVADLSFVALRGLVPSLVAVAADGADLVFLVKPQFEAERGDVDAGGVVRDPDAWRRAVADVAAACREVGAGPLAAMASPILGPAGNVEFFLHATTGGDRDPQVDLDAAIREGERIGHVG